MKTTDKYVGLDVHKDTTVMAVAEGGREGEVRLYGTISSDPHALERVLAKLGGESVRLHVVYEAGPTEGPPKGGPPKGTGRALLVLGRNRTLNK